MALSDEEKAELQRLLEREEYHKAYMRDYQRRKRELKKELLLKAGHKEGCSLRGCVDGCSCDACLLERFGPPPVGFGPEGPSRA